MARVASRIRLRRSRWASDPSSDSASTATVITWRGRDSDPDPWFGCDRPDIWSTTPSSACVPTEIHGNPRKTIRMPNFIFSLQDRRGTDVSCCYGGRLDDRSLALLEHVLV